MCVIYRCHQPIQETQNELHVTLNWLNSMKRFAISAKRVGFETVALTSNNLVINNWVKYRKVHPQFTFSFVKFSEFSKLNKNSNGKEHNVFSNSWREIGCDLLKTIFKRDFQWFPVTLSDLSDDDFKHIDKQQVPKFKSQKYLWLMVLCQNIYQPQISYFIIIWGPIWQWLEVKTDVEGEAKHGL